MLGFTPYVRISDEKTEPRLEDFQVRLVVEATSRAEHLEDVGRQAASQGPACRPVRTQPSAVKFEPAEGGWMLLDAHQKKILSAILGPIHRTQDCHPARVLLSSHQALCFNNFLSYERHPLP